MVVLRYPSNAEDYVSLPALSRSDRPKPSTNSSERAHTFRVPSVPSETTVMSAPNSYRNWRHAPHGDAGPVAELVTATASILLAPAATAVDAATRSAQIESPYDAFSTFAPEKIPRSVETAAPTRNRL